MTNRLELNWKLDGFVDEQRYYCSETPIDTENLPVPKTVLAGDIRTYVDTAIELGKTYHVCVGSVKNGVEKLSEQKQVGVGFWTPSDLPFEIIFTSSDNVILVNNLVSELVDIGGGNRSFTQGDQARCPAFIEYGNFNAIRFDGINDFLGSIAANNFLAGKNCAWIFTVFKASSAKAQGVVGTRAADNRSGRFNIYAGTGSYPTKVGMLTRSTDGGSASLTYNTEDTGTAQFRMILGYRDYTKTSQKVVIDAANSYTTTTEIGVISSTQGAASAVIGAETSIPSSLFDGDVCCVLLGVNPLTQQEQDKIFGWAAHKYGLTANLPSGHPYKTLVPTI